MSDLLKWWANTPCLGRRSAFRKWCRKNRGVTSRIKTRHQFQMELTCGDSVANQLLVYGTFEPHLTERITQLAKQNYSFIDVGCNVGYFSCLFSQHSAHDILAIDANPAMCQATAHNGQLNRFTIDVVHAAITEERKRVTLSWPTNAPSHASLAGSCEEHVEVEGIPLSPLLEERDWSHPTVLKVDIEGYEIPLLRSITDPTPFHHILFEWSEENYRRAGFSPQDLWKIEWLKPYQWRGFDSKKCLEHTLQWGEEPPPWVDTLWASYDHLSCH